MDFLDGMLGGGLNSSRKNTTTNTSNNTNSNGRSKICRSASELDMEQTSGAQDWRSPAGSASSIKMPRTDSYPALMRTSSVISEANNAHSTNSDFLEDSRGLLRSSDASGVSPYARSCLPFCHQQQQQQQLGAYPQYSNNGSVNAIRSSSGGMPLLMGASAGGVGMGMGMGMNAILRSPFTASQWQELEHQALIFKYILARAPVPSELLIPLRTKSNSLNIFSSMPLTGSSIRPTLGWNSYHLGFANNADPEPGRCRRTDGKKWRCSRDAVPDQKYCERHMNRGRHRSRKPVEGETTTTIATTNATAATASPSNNHVVSSSPAASNAASLASATARPAGGLTSPNVNATSLSAHSSQTNALRSCSLVPQHHQNQIGAAAATQLTKLSSFSSAMASSASNFQMPLNVDGFMGGGVLKGDVRTGHIFESSTGLSMMTSHSNTSSSTTQAQEAAAAATNVASAWRSRMTAATRGATTATTTTIATSSDQNVLSYDANDLAHMNLFHHPQNPRADDSDSPGIRHFFDDWPGSRERSVHWPNANSATHLSISVNSPGGGGSSPEKITLSPLKLSMSGRDDPLGMELGLANDNETASGDDHRQRPTANWIPITWESSVGGPLAEVLNNTATGNSREFKNSLNLMTDGWECTGSPRGDGSRMASPTGVLQKTTFGSLSDSSTGSSPRAVVVKPESSGGGLTTGAFCENVRSASAFNPAAPISTS